MSIMYSPSRHPLAQPTQPTSGKTDMDYHVKEWTSGTQGAGRLPDDFEWGTNPKQNQEENGASNLTDGETAPAAPNATKAP
jgi:hypothetical protein